MTIRIFDEDIYISEEEMKEVSKEVVNAIKEKLPKEYHRECIINAILLEVKRMLSLKLLDL